MTTIQCLKCNKTPAELDEYVSMAEDEDMTPDEFVREEEGTYNSETGAFWCTSCYIKVGMPLGVAV